MRTKTTCIFSSIEISNRALAPYLFPIPSSQYFELLNPTSLILLSKPKKESKMAQKTRSMHLLKLDRLIFTPMEQSYTWELEQISIWMKMGVENKRWPFKVGLVGVFEIDWRRSHRDLLVEFLNTWQEKEDIIYIRTWEKIVVINRHVITYSLKIFNIGCKE